MVFTIPVYTTYLELYYQSDAFLLRSELRANWTDQLRIVIFNDENKFNLDRLDVEVLLARSSAEWWMYFE